MDKESIRHKIKEKKELLSSQEIERKSEKIINSLMSLSVYKNAEIIFCYVAFNQEVRTARLITQALLDGKKIYVPKIEEGKMIAIELNSLSDLEPGFFGILEPKSKAQMECKPNTLVIVPGLAFDKAGRRIGYGKGFYDKYFNLYGEDLFIKVALGYEFQIHEMLPESFGDVKMNMILTEKGTYSIK
jgi:5-formyltetrahydrofolate cyclo-ligase